MKLLIIGHKGSGKSHIAKVLAERLGVPYQDSSAYCFEKIVYPALKDKYGYKSHAEALEDKDNRRADWFKLIAEYNTVPDRLTKNILADNDIYVGMRNRREYEGSKHHFDLIVWIDAASRVENESTSSMELSVSDAYYIFNNNGDVKDISDEVDLLVFTVNEMTASAAEYAI